ncbi:hypothetical protein D9M68_912470 [compost metagenome]
MREGAGMSFISLSAMCRAVSDVAIGMKTVSDFSKSFHRDNEKRKRDPFMPALRSKGEKARNRSKRK